MVSSWFYYKEICYNVRSHKRKMRWSVNKLGKCTRAVWVSSVPTFMVGLKVCVPVAKWMVHRLSELQQWACNKVCIDVEQFRCSEGLVNCVIALSET